VGDTVDPQATLCSFGRERSTPERRRRMSETARHTTERARAREQRVIGFLLAGRSLQQIIEETPISRTELWRLRKRNDFQVHFTEARAQALDSAVNALHDGAVVFVQTLREICQDSRARGSERATAARSGLDSLFRAAELFDVEARLRKLEQIAAGGEK
jgi:hypothetical protein